MSRRFPDSVPTNIRAALESVGLFSAPNFGATPGCFLDPDYKRKKTLADLVLEVEAEEAAQRAKTGVVGDVVLPGSVEIQPIPEE